MDLNSNEQEEEKQSLTSSRSSLLSCQQTSSQSDAGNNNNSSQTPGLGKDVIELSEHLPRIRPLRPETRRRPSSGGNAGRNGNLSTSPAFTTNVSVESLDSTSGAADTPALMMSISMTTASESPSYGPPRLPPKSNPHNSMLSDLTVSGPLDAGQRGRIKSLGSNPIHKPRMTLPSHDELSSSASNSPASAGSPRQGLSPTHGPAFERQPPPPVVPRKSLSSASREDEVYKNINSIRPNRRPNNNI